MPNVVLVADPVAIVKVQSGPAGVPGNVDLISGTSSSTVAVAVGLRTFVTQGGKAFLFGHRLRAVDQVTGYSVEGTVVSYAGTALVLNVDLVVGDGDASDWTIAPTGSPGAVPYRIYVSESDPTGGFDGDIWFKI